MSAQTIDIRKAYPSKPSMLFIRADLARKGYRLSNDLATWFIATRTH